MKFSTANALVRAVILPLAMTALCACGGVFSTGNSTEPGSTPNISAQTSFRIVGTIGTPFQATISSKDAAWTVRGVIPLSIIIVKNNPPNRIVVTKTVNDDSLLSIEITTGLTVQLLTSTNEPYGVAVAGALSGGANGFLNAFAPLAGPNSPTSPDVRFFVKGPNTGVFNALIEDLNSGEILQSHAPFLVLFDAPNGGSQTERVDGIFTQVNFIGAFDIDLIFNGVVVDSAVGGGTGIVKYH